VILGHHSFPLMFLQHTVEPDQEGGERLSAELRTVQLDIEDVFARRR
jgi:hypothetical protein